MSYSSEPMWYCHECHAEMRPLMAPDPHCASCRGTFVEMMDDPGDDPRGMASPALQDFLLPNHPSHGPPGNGRPTGGMAGVLELLAATMRPNTNNGDGSSGGSMRFVLSTPTGTRTVQLGGPNTVRPRDGLSDSESGVPRLSEFIASTTSEPPPADGGNQTRRAPGPLLLSYLLSSLLGGAAGRDRVIIDPYEQLATGRFGDYAINEQALENILAELMANAPGQPTDPPAPDDVIDNLPRVVLEAGHPLLNDSCAICHEPFNPALASSPDAGPDASELSSSSTNSDKKASLPMIGATLPCNHTFHEECILPWLKLKSTCPVCRKSVLPNSQDSSSGSGSSPNSASQGQEHRIPGAWDSLD